ncbi:hypothetical protein BGZ75_001284, partial [Mortierella antarctica]
VADETGHVLTSRNSVTQPPANKKVVIEAFLDVEKVTALCRSHGLAFRDRITFVDPYTVRLTGAVIKKDGDRERHPVVSRYEERRRYSRGQPSNYWLDAFKDSGLTKQEAFQKASALADEVKAQERVVKAQRKKVNSSLQVQTALKDDLKQSKSDAAQKELKDAQQILRKNREELYPLEETLQMLKQDRYRWNKIQKAAADYDNADDPKRDETGRTQQPRAKKDTVPTWELPACEDRVNKIDLRDLVSNARGKDRLITFAGSDYGLVTMSETIPLTLAQVEAHLNRFAILEKDPDAVIEEELSDIKLPKAIKITAEQVNSVSKTRQIGKRREARLKKDQKVQDAMALISEPASSLSMASTLPDVDRAHSQRKTVSGVLQQFERSKARLKDLHGQRIRTDCAWKRLCAQERRKIQQHAMQAVSG